MSVKFNSRRFFSSRFAVGKNIVLSLIGVMCFGFFASAQMVNKDSLSLAKRVQSDQEKLTKMRTNVSTAEKEMNETAAKAKESAEDNRKAANKLSEDPQDRKLAKRADNTAGDARSDAKKARKAADRLTDLNKDIQELTERIAKNQTKLNRFQLANKPETTVPAVVLDKDSVGK